MILGLVICYWMESAAIHLEGLAHIICTKYPCSECLDSFFLSIIFYPVPLILKRACILQYVQPFSLECLAHNLEKGKVFQLVSFSKFLFPSHFLPSLAHSDFLKCFAFLVLKMHPGLCLHQRQTCLKKP